MAKRRTRTADLARLLNPTGRPIYVLDDQRAIVFCNDACLDWLGRSDVELLGRGCDYHSIPDVDDLAAAAAGLAPPPGAFLGQITTGTVASADGTGRIRHRHARFVPLGDPDADALALFVLVDEQDLPEEAEDPATAPRCVEPTPDLLHDRIRRFRHEVAGRYRIDRLVGESPAMRRVREQVKLAAGCTAAVLVVGPPGSGRQHVASAIHHGADPDRQGSLIPLACSALGPDLIQSTVRALAAHPSGEKVARNTLLLNDVDQLPVETHGELAEILSSRSFHPRVLATAERPLAELVRRGDYRADLAALLDTLVIELPPLRERREDLPLLAQLLLEDVNSRGAKQVGGFTPDALDRLDAYAWPGNLDELARVVVEAHRRAEGTEITVSDLPKRIHLAADAAAHPRAPEETIQLDAFLGQIERELIRRALALARGNKAKAARVLGLTRPRLYRRLVQLGMED